MFKVNNRNTTTGFEICSFGTYFTSCYSVSIVNFEQVNAGWVNTFRLLKKCLIYIQFTPIYSKCSISITTENIQKFSVFRGYLIASGGIIGEGISRTKTKGSKESSRDRGNTRNILRWFIKTNVIFWITLKGFVFLNCLTFKTARGLNDERM